MKELQQLGKVKKVRPRAHRACSNSEIGNLFSHAGEDTGWRPPEELPVLDDRFKTIGFDLETDGTDVFGKSKPIGYSLTLEDGRRLYLPTGHRGGGNLDKGLVIRYLQKELRNKDLVTCEGKFEVHMSRKDGLDLEAQNNRIREVQFKAALLDDQRRSFKLDDLAADFLGKRKKPMERDRIWELPSYEVGPYAEEDSAITLELHQHLTPKIEAEGLTRVARLEDDLMWCTCEMERNGVPINVGKLDLWHNEITSRYSAIIRRTVDEVGFKVNPDSGPDLARLFNRLDLPYGRTIKGAPSFTDEALREVDHPLVRELRLARGLNSLKSKYLGAYRKRLVDGILHYKLHQMKADDEHGGMFGTISGRYSSSSINIQQVFDRKRQIKKFGVADYIIRELFIPRPGRLWVKADAKQIEYRLFGHYANSPAINERYRRNPETDFHEIVQEMIRPFRVIDRQDAKNVNFAKLYGSAAPKLSRMLNISVEEAQELINIYDAAIPEARDLMKKAMSLVKARGYVKTILGRRARFKKTKGPAWYNPDIIIEEYDRIYSALNRAIQGSAADIMKMKLLEVYNNRKTLDFHMFYTVHDDVNGDVGSVEAAKRLEELLNEQIAELKLRIPILWDVSTGESWAEAA